MQELIDKLKLKEKEASKIEIIAACRVQRVNLIVHLQNKKDPQTFTLGIHKPVGSVPTVHVTYHPK